MDDYMFELDGVEFGISAPVSVDEEGFDMGASEIAVQDSDNPQMDGILFGRDYRRPPAWTWNLFANQETPEDALEVMNALAVIWRGDEVRDIPTAVMPLRYGIAGRTRRVYGRPRRWAPTLNNRLIGGYLPIVADFQLASDLSFDDTEGSVTVDMDATSPGGMVFPDEFPITTMASGSREGQILSTGDVDTFPVIRINGPVTDPWVQHNDWRLDFDIGLASGQYIEIDTHPWANTILRNGTASVAGTLSPRQRLRDVRIHPGDQEITFGGSSTGAPTSCVVTWRSAHASF